MLRTLVSALVLLTAATLANGEIWSPSADGEVVERADAIVVATIKPGSIKYVPHTAKKPSHGRSWEHHVTIVVKRTIKGELTAGEHRVILHYGLTPCVGGKWAQDGNLVNLQDREDGVIEIVGSTLRHGFRDEVDDVREDHVWLLRRGHAGGTGVVDPKEMLGIVDPTDVQPLERLSYLELYLQDDPEAALRLYVQEHPDEAGRVLPYLRHRAVQAAIADPDPARRVERLLPYFASYVLYCGLDEAGDAIEATGETAVPYLIALLDDSGLYESRRTLVLEMLGHIGSKRAAPALIRFLDSHNAALASVAKAAEDRNDALDGPDVSRRLHEMASAVYALSLIREPSSLDLIRSVRWTWSTVLPKDHSLLDCCENALERLSPLQDD